MPKSPSILQSSVYQITAFLNHADNAVCGNGSIISVVKECGDLVRNVNIFDVFSGNGVPEGKKSIAFSAILQSTEKTLEDADISSFSDSVIRNLADKLGAVLRD